MKTIFIILIQSIKKFKEDNAFSLASHITYYTLLSFFPFFIFLLTLLGFFPISSESVLKDILTFIPQPAVKTVSQVLNEVLNYRHVTLLSFSFILSLWSASSGCKALMLGINKAYSVQDRRSYIKIKFISMIYTVIFAFLIIGSFLFLTFGEHLIALLYSTLNISLSSFWITNLLRITLLILILFIVFILMYKYTTPLKPPIMSVSYGALFSTAGIYGLSRLYGIYINYFANKSLVYGSIGGIYVMIIWLNIISLLILFGAEINSVIYKKYYN